MLRACSLERSKYDDSAYLCFLAVTASFVILYSVKEVKLCFLRFLTVFQFVLFPSMSFYKSNVKSFLLQSKQKWCKNKQSEESPIGRKLSDQKLNNRPDADWLQLKPLAGRHLFSAFFLSVRFKVMTRNFWHVACNLLYNCAAIM